MEFANVKAFAESSADLCEAIKTYATNCTNERKGVVAFADHSKEEMNALINKAFVNEVAKQSGVEFAENANKTDIQRYCNNPMVKYFANQIQDVMVDAVFPIVLGASSLRYIADVKYADLGDTIKYDIKSNALFTVSKAGYRQRETNKQRTFRTTITTSGVNHELTVGTTLFEIITGQSYVAEEIMKIARSMELAMYTEAVDAFTTTTTGLGTPLVVTGYSEAALITLCERVGAYNAGQKPIIIGTPQALKAVLPTNANYRYFLDDEYVKLGHITTFNGIDVVPMEQVADLANGSAYGLKLPNDKIWVVSPAADKIMKLGVFGGTMSHTDAPYDKANKAINTTMEKAWSVDCVTSSICGVITL